MAQTIKLKRSATSGAAPTTSQLELGEVAINTYDGKMYIKKNVGGTESIVEIGGGTGGSSTLSGLSDVTVSSVAADQLLQYNGSEWVNVSIAEASAIMKEYQFTATSGQSTFSGSDDNSETLSYTAGAIQVFLNGIFLDSAVDYTATNGTSIVLSETVDANDYLQVVAFKKKIGDGNVSVDTFTGDDSTTAFTLSLDPGDENNTRVFIDGVYQSKSNYSVSGTTLTFSTAPPADTAVEVEIGNRVVTLDTLSDLDLPDDVKLRLGTGQDLQIYHDGSHSYINEQGTGNLYLNTTNGGGVFLTSAGENLALFNSNGAANLYYDGSAKLATTNDGVTVTGDVEADEFIGDVRGAVLFKAQAGETLAKGEVVYISGISGNTTIVSKADADDASKMPAFGLVAVAASSGNPVDIYTNGILSDIDTSAYSEGDELFVSTTAGSLTATAPTGESAALQKIGKVTRSNATSGSIFIVGAGRSNAVPNLDDGDIFIGNSSNQAVSASLNTKIESYLDGGTSTPTFAGLTTTADVSFGDNDKAIFGAGSDLQIYHTGSNSFIQDTGVGDLYLTTNGDKIILRNTTLGESFFEGTSNGDAKIFYNGLEKLATTSTGIDVTGTVVADGLESSGNLSFTAADGMLISAKESLIVNIDNDDNDSNRAFIVQSGATGSTESLIVASEDAGVTLYYDNSAKLATTSTGIDVTGITVTDGLTSDGALTINGSGSEDRYLKFALDGRGSAFTGENAAFIFCGQGGSGDFLAGGLYLQSRSATAGREIGFITGTTPTKRMVIDSSGNVGIGTQIPSELLEVRKDSANAIIKVQTGGGHDARLILDAPAASGAQSQIFFDASGTTAGSIQYTHNSGGTNFMTFHTGGSNVERMRINDAGNVGIGVVPDSFNTVDGALQVGTRNTLTSFSNDIGIGYNHYYNSGWKYANTDAAARFSSNSGIPFLWQYAASGSADGAITWSEAMRIDASGNLLVGTTSAYGTTGTTINAAGLVYSSSDGDRAGQFDRTTSDGEIVRFSKAGTTVGSIGTFGTDVYIGTNDSGLRFEYAGLNSIVPFDVNSLAISDAATDLGHGNARFKDIHLSGTSYTNQVELAEISTSNSDTAVDVFVYDTRKDSDGGAWRKRTQNTSWYNETLNTSTRGARKEFPSVAVIVYEEDQLTIYDGDDPDMPMWMVINAGGGEPLYAGGTSNTCEALNGELIAGSGSVSVAGALSHFNFIKDFAYLRINSTNAYNAVNIAKRNTGFSTDTITGTTEALVNRSINDVSMTVLPNAPIDADTGLPVPTIAVATNGGVSIIKDDGNVYDSSDTSAYGSVEFIDERIVSDRNTSETRYFISQKVSTITADSWNLYEYYTGDFSTGYPLIRSDTGSSIITKAKDHSVRGSNVGLSFWDWKESDNDSSQGAYFNNSLMSYVTSDYNTGWMHGDIKLAALSDTDTTNANPSELISNGDFSNGTTGWTAQLGANLSVSSGQLTVVSTGANSLAYQYFTADLTKSYILKVTVVSGSVVLQTGGFSSGTLSAGTYTINMNAGRTNNKLDIAPLTNGTAVVDNISLKLAEQDRSVNGKGLQVFGTVTKTAVATDADLVAYSGFSSSNYLEQPNNSDFEFGTNDWSMMGWITQNGTASTQHPIQLGLISGSSSEISILRQTSSSDMLLGFRVRGDSGAYAAYPSGGLMTNNVWRHFVLTKRGSELLWYIDGIKIYSISSPTNIGNIGFSSSDVLRIGHGASTVTADVMKLALLRISATAPSPEQIKKIYNDEKHLFQENAKATLYGSSDAVTALAYDDDIELLHVGTSAGRSVFQGLNRVDNTTDAVGAAISASNGFIVED